jgi:putative SOS response-associated peptidase YedK
MCGRFTALSFEEVQALADALESCAPFSVLPDWIAARGDVYPHRDACIVGVSREGHLEAMRRTWGYLPAGETDLVFNTRIETAATTPLWRESFAHGRCIVPAASFYERHASEQARSPRTGRLVRQLYRFTLPGSETILMAGVQNGQRFSVVTTRPNESVRHIHNRMPLLLSRDEAHAWAHAEIDAPDCSSIELASEPTLPSAEDDGEQLALF